MFAQRSQALLEQRGRIRQYADRWMWGIFDHLDNPSMEDQRQYKFKIHVESFLDDDLKIQQVLSLCEKQYQEKNLEVDVDHLPIMADELHDVLSASYPGRSMKIEVTVGNHGCIVDYLTSKPKTISV